MRRTGTCAASGEKLLGNGSIGEPPASSWSSHALWPGVHGEPGYRPIAPQGLDGGSRGEPVATEASNEGPLHAVLSVSDKAGRHVHQHESVGAKPTARGVDLRQVRDVNTVFCSNVCLLWLARRALDAGAMGVGPIRLCR